MSFKIVTLIENIKNGNAIGLIYMMNLGDVRPESDKLFQKL